MSYNKYTWQIGETITAEKLNNIENGIEENGGGSNLVILPFTTARNTIITTLTYSDIADVYTKYQSGDVVVLTIDMGSSRTTLFVNNIYYTAAEYGNPEQYAVYAAGFDGFVGQNNASVYLVTVVFQNGAETTADFSVKRIPLLDYE